MIWYQPLVCPWTDRQAERKREREEDREKDTVPCLSLAIFHTACLEACLLFILLVVMAGFG